MAGRSLSCVGSRCSATRTVALWGPFGALWVAVKGTEGGTEKTMDVKRTEPTSHRPSGPPPALSRGPRLPFRAPCHPHSLRCRLQRLGPSRASHALPTGVARWGQRWGSIGAPMGNVSDRKGLACVYGGARVRYTPCIASQRVG